MRTLVLYVTLSLFQFASIGQESWHQIENLPDTVRNHAVGFSIGDKGYIVGGMINCAPPDMVQRGFFEYAPSSNSWTRKVDFPKPITEAISFVIDSKVYLTTGRDSTHFVKNENLYLWDTTLTEWTDLGQIPSEIKRIRGIGFSIGNRGYVATGLDSIQTTFLADLWEYDPLANSWTQKANFPGAPRYDAACFVIGDKAYITTGCSMLQSTTDLWEYDPVGDSWVQKASFIGPELDGCVGLSLNDKGYIITGWVSTPPFQFHNRVWEYDPQSDSWEELDYFPGLHRTYSTGFVINDKGYTISGWYWHIPINDNWELSPPPVVIDKSETPNNHIYPNPVSRELNIKIESSYIGNVQITLEDLCGRLILNHSTFKDATNFLSSLNLSSVRNGSYILLVLDNNEQVIFKCKVLKI